MPGWSSGTGGVDVVSKTGWGQQTAPLSIRSARYQRVNCQQSCEWERGTGRGGGRQQRSRNAETETEAVTATATATATGTGSGALTQIRNVWTAPSLC